MLKSSSRLGENEPNYSIPYDGGFGPSAPAQSGAGKMPSPRRLFADLRDVGRLSHISPEVLNGFVRLADIALVTLLGLIIAVGYVRDLGPESVVLYGVASVIAGLLTALTFQGFRLYRTSAYAHIPRQLPRLLSAWCLVFVTLAALAFVMKLGATFSRVWFVSWFALGGCMLLGMRIFLANLVRSWGASGRLNRYAVVVGGGDAGERLLQQLEAIPETDLRVCGVFDDRGSERVGEATAGYPRLGTLDDLLTFARTSRIDLLIVTLPMTAEDRLLQVFRKLWVLPVDIRLAAHTNSLKFRPKAYSFIGRVPVIDVSDRPMSNWDVILKSVFDKVIAAGAIVALSPLMLATAVAIKATSKGPIIFRQKRYGFNNEMVEVFKFRSMYTDMSDADAAKLVTREDPRVTRVGRFIRKTSIDELPQLFNVMTGQLSLVGPRPHAVQAKAADELYHDVVDGYFARHKVKPGITGWAQINGWRGETDTREKIEKRVEHDLYYIENWSILFDLYILAKTPFSLLGNKNAY
ncbi:MAG: undecaprenyl-phosphate glucose phosphotransferase [Pseudomonadota bacterium]